VRSGKMTVHDFVIMPNHFHGILRIVDAMPSRGAASSAPTVDRPKLGEIIRAFKSLSAIEINRILSRRGEAVWQRNYYEHIIRDEKDFQTVREYIRENPVCWNLDPENI
jgi:putative transposase